MRNLTFLTMAFSFAVFFFFYQGKNSNVLEEPSQPRGLAQNEAAKPNEEYYSINNLEATPIEPDRFKTNRDKIVEEKINIFMAKTARITEESVAVERNRITQGLKKIKAHQEEMPIITMVTDENGDKWERLQFRNGTLRFMPISEEGTDL